MAVPAVLAPYCRELVALSRAAFGDGLVGVYAIGSVGLGDYRPPGSDLDIAVVTAGGGDPEAFAQRLAATAPDLPARKLELVVYDADRLAAGEATFRANINVERDGTLTLDLDPATVPSFWFVIDMAIAREHGVALHGPAPREVIGAQPEDVIRRALADGTAFHGESARAEVYRRDGVWVSKAEAARRLS